jgi:hypothetical protein
MEKIEHIAYNSDETDNFKNELSLSKASIRKAIDIVNNMNTLDDHREKLEKLIKNEALIETQPSLEGTSTYADNTKGNAIYYGTGLATPKHPAIGLPFDVLGMVLVAEKIKRTLGLSDIYHHIADTHAKTNEWADAEAIDRRAHETQYILNLMADNLKLDGFHVMLSSEFDQSEEYKEILREFNGSDKHDY